MRVVLTLNWSGIEAEQHTQKSDPTQGRKIRRDRRESFEVTLLGFLDRNLEREREMEVGESNLCLSEMKS